VKGQRFCVLKVVWAGIYSCTLKFLRRTAGYTLLDHKKNEDILQELNTTPVLEKITKYRHNWVKHVHRMNNSRFPKALIEYHPRGRRRPGRPLKRLLDGVQIGTETGHMGLISCGIRRRRLSKWPVSKKP
jgi:hypothetical protein